MNLVIMMGRATKDPETRYSGDLAISNFDIAVDRKFKKEGEATADFFSCTAFGKTAQVIEKYLKKGGKVVVQGRLQNDNYKDKEGKTVYKNQIIIDNFEFAESKKASEEAESESMEIANNNPPAPDGFINVPDDFGGLPFK